jgi:hypothetical protein
MAQQVRFDTTISLGNLISAVSFLILAVFAWRDMSWRIKNLEVWRKEHMLDSDGRDKLLQKMNKVLDHVRWQTNLMRTGHTKPYPEDLWPKNDDDE